MNSDKYLQSSSASSKSIQSSSSTSLDDISTIILTPKKNLKSTENGSTDKSSQSSTSHTEETKRLQKKITLNKYSSSESFHSSGITENNFNLRQQLFRKSASLYKNSSDSSSTSSLEQIKAHFDKQPDLYEIIFYLEYSVNHTIDEWIKRFEVDSEEAMLLIIQFIISCCGCEGQKMTIDLLHNFEGLSMTNKIVKWMETNYDNNPNKVDHPLFQSNIKLKHFWDFLSNFWYAFVEKCPESILCSDFFDGIVIGFLIEISNNQHNDEYNKAFLMVSTTIALKIATGVLKIKSLNKKYKIIFDTIVKKVYKDKISMSYNNVVLTCVTEYCEWIIIAPSLINFELNEENIENSIFLDAFIPIRHVAMKGLLDVFEKYKNVPKALQSFIENAVLIAVISLNDTIPSIVVKGIKILSIAKKVNPSIVSETYENRIFYFVYHLHPEISKAAGMHLNQALTEYIDISDSKAVLTNLVIFYKETVEARSVTRLVNSLVGINDAIIDWKAMVDLLVNNFPDNNEDAQILTRIIVCCVKQASVNGDSDNKTILEKQKEAKKEITKYFGEVILSLVQQSKERDPVILSKLLEIPRCFDAGIILQNEYRLEMLLSELCLIIEEEFDEQVLNAASKALEVLYKNTKHNICSIKISAISNKLINSFIKYYGTCKGYMTNNQNLSQDTLYGFLVITKQLFALYFCHNLNSCKLWSTLMNSLKILFEYFKQLGIYAASLVIYTVKILSLSLIWSKIEYNIDMDLLDLKSCKEERTNTMKNEVTEYINMIVIILKNEFKIFDHKLRAETFKAACDVTWRLCEFIQDENFASELFHFLDDYIFVKTFEKDLEDPKETDEICLERAKLLLKSYSKLVVFKRSFYRTSSIAKYYVEYSDIYGEIIEQTIKELATNNRELTINELFFTLFYIYNESFESNLNAQKNLDIATDNFRRILRLNIKDSAYLETLHKKVIEDVLNNEEHQIFFRMLRTFAKDISKNSKKELLKLLEEEMRSNPRKSAIYDQNIINYKLFLEQKEVLSRKNK